MRPLLSLVFLLLFCVTASAEVIVLNGVYQGKDLYVKNPETKSGVGYCVFEVLVNGKVSADEVNSPAFAVDLKAWGLKIGDALEIVLRCKEDCEVKIINPEVIYPNSTYELTTINLAADGLLTWNAIKETASLPYSVEQFKWNKWSKVGEVQGKGIPEECAYSFQATLTSGVNLFRIQQLDHKGAHFSQELRVSSNTPDVQLKSTRISKTIEFTQATQYEVYSEFGERVAIGTGQTVDSSKYPKGNYYINFDNKTGVQVEKK